MEIISSLHIQIFLVEMIFIIMDVDVFKNKDLVPVRCPWTVPLARLLEVILLLDSCLQINKVKKKGREQN